MIWNCLDLSQIVSLVMKGRFCICVSSRTSVIVLGLASLTMNFAMNFLTTVYNFLGVPEIGSLPLQHHGNGTHILYSNLGCGMAEFARNSFENVTDEITQVGFFITIQWTPYNKPTLGQPVWAYSGHRLISHRIMIPAA